MGLECSGYLVDQKNNQVTNQKVMALLSGGGYAQFAKVNKNHIMEMAPNIDFVQVNFG